MRSEVKDPERNRAGHWLSVQEMELDTGCLYKKWSWVFSLKLQGYAVHLKKQLQYLYTKVQLGVGNLLSILACCFLREHRCNAIQYGSE